MHLELTSEIAAALQARAEAQSRTPEEVVLEILRRDLRLIVNEENEKASLADMLGDAIGSVDSRTVTGSDVTNMSSSENAFARGMLEKREQGHL